MQQALTALGNKVDGVYAANDGTGGGAIKFMVTGAVLLLAVAMDATVRSRRESSGR